MVTLQSLQKSKSTPRLATTEGDVSTHLSLEYSLSLYALNTPQLYTSLRCYK